LNVRANFIIDASKERKVVFMGFPFFVLWKLRFSRAVMNT